MATCATSQQLVFSVVISLDAVPPPGKPKLHCPTDVWPERTRSPSDSLPIPIRSIHVYLAHVLFEHLLEVGSYATVPGEQHPEQ